MAEHYKSIFESAGNELPENACSNLCHARENALSELESIGLPNNRMEYWKYSRIGKVLKGLEVNLGLVDEELRSLPSPLNVEYSSLSKAIADNHPLIEKHLGKYAGIVNAGLTALNTAFFSNGIFIHVPDDTVVEDPIYLPQHSANADSGIVQPRNLIVVGRNSSVTIISEGTSGSTDAMINAIEEIVVGENASLSQYILQNDEGNSVNGSYVLQEKDSRYSRVTTTLSGTFVRNNVNVRMEGTGCESNLYGYYHIRGKNQVDNHTIVEHKEPDCLSNELYVGLLDEDASGIFNGRVMVHQDAQRTNAFQSNKNILLSDNATMNTKPELEIYADDVKCSHGATIGQVDQEALFYLQSRGIPKQIAMSMLLQGFSIEVTDKIVDEDFRGNVLEQILDHLNTG
jgi:Fe-S cluster assembly protein SufD